MLEFTRLAEERMVSPNETILQRGQAVEHFFMIRKGEVDMHGQTTLRLRPRQFFGEIELLQGGGALTEVRAGSEPVELLTIPRADFTRVIQESPITAEVLLKVAQEKMEALKEDKLAAKP